MPVLSNVVALMRQHHILLWICAVVALNQLGFGIVVPVLPLFAEQFGVPQTAIGLAVAVYGLGRLLFNMPMGQLTERLGRRQVVFWGEIITAVGSLLCGLAPSFEWLLLFRFIGGIGAATVLTGAQVIITDISTRANRGRIMSVYMGWFLFAVGLGPTPGGLLAREFGLQAPFFAFAIMSLLAALLCWWKLPETCHLAERRPPTGGLPASGQPRTWPVLRQLMARPAFPLVSLVTFAQFMARTGAIFTVVPLFVHDRLGLDPLQIGLALTIGNVVNLTMTPIAGILVDRFGRRPIIVPGTLLSGLAFAAFAGVTSYPHFLLICLLWGLAGGIGGTAPGAYAADLAPPGANGVTMGIYRTLSDAGYVVGPALLGLIADSFGAEPALLTMGSVFIVAGLLFGLFAPETHRRVAAKAAAD
jgi:MFS transporter, DHA1 family, multidrug resistance protein